MTVFASEATLTTDDLERTTAPTLVLSGDDDGVRLDHTSAMFLALPAGQLAVLAGIVPCRTDREAGRRGPAGGRLPLVRPAERRSCRSSAPRDELTGAVRARRPFGSPRTPAVRARRPFGSPRTGPDRPSRTEWRNRPTPDRPLSSPLRAWW